MKALAKKLRDLRIENGCISQLILSEATGISQSSLARWELGKTEPRASELIVLCKYYGISADELLGLDALPATSAPMRPTVPLSIRSDRNEKF